jgi:hypothetical protein
MNGINPISLRLMARRKTDMQENEINCPKCGNQWDEFTSLWVDENANPCSQDMAFAPQCPSCGYIWPVAIDVVPIKDIEQLQLDMDLSDDDDDWWEDDADDDDDPEDDWNDDEEDYDDSEFNLGEADDSESNILGNVVYHDVSDDFRQAYEDLCS